MYLSLSLSLSLSLLPPPPLVYLINDIAESEDLLSCEDEESDTGGFEQDRANQTKHLVSSKVKGKQVNKKSKSGKIGACTCVCGVL